MTLLSQQLQKLALPKDQVKSGAIQHSSLIFSTRVASDYDIQDIYDIGINGFEELVALNPCFSQFKNTLFHPTSTKFERLVKTEEFLEGVDKELVLFLAHVSNYGLLSPAHKALEWLIRAYKIHLYNAEALLTAFIPLHDSKVFAKILEIIALPDNWKWLESAKENNVNIGRNELVKLCTSNPHYLTYFMERSLHMIEQTGNTALIHHSFLVTLVFLVLERFDEVPQDIIPKIYSCIMKAVSSSNKDLKSAGYIITGQLVRKVSLKDSIVTDLICAVSANPDPGLVKELILTLSCILHHHKTVAGLPAACVELVLQEEFLAALTLVHEKNDISAFIKELLVTLVQMSFTAGVLLQKKMLPLFQLSDLSETIAAGLCDKYFELYFQYPDETRSSASVKTLGEMLAATFPTQIQDTFQGFHEGGCDMTVLASMKTLILGQYLGNKASQKLLEISHDLPGIRMLGLLKVSEQLSAGTGIKEEEREGIVKSVLARITDQNDSVAVKSMELVKQFLEDEAVYRSVLSAVLEKVRCLVEGKTVNQEAAVSIISVLLSYPPSVLLQNTMLVVLVNLVPVCDQHFKKQIAVQLRSSSELKQLCPCVAGEGWDATLVSFLAQYPDRRGVVEMMCGVPTPQNFKWVCALQSTAGEEEVHIMCRYFLDILDTAVERKFEYKEFKMSESQDETISSKAVKFFKNFAVMKREWEMVGLVTAVFASLGPKITDPQDMKKVLLFWIRYSDLHGPNKTMIASVNKAVLYKTAMEVILSDDPSAVLISSGLTSPTALDNLLEIVKLVKISEPEELADALPYLLCSLVSSDEQVRAWSYKRLKALSKLDAPTSTSAYLLQKLQLQKNIATDELKEELGRVCEAKDAQVSSWLEITLPRGRDLAKLYEILGGVQHPAKLLYSLSSIVKDGYSSSAVLGEYTSITASLLLSDPSLLKLYLTALKNSTALLAETLTPGFVEGLPRASRDVVVRAMLEECGMEKQEEEHVRLLIRQKLTELGTETTLPAMMTILKDTPTTNPHVLHVLSMQGAATTELSTILFELLGTRKGTEEDIVTLLISVCNSLGPNTPLTPTALKTIVQVIRDTNKQTHRHVLHHNCIVLLSKLAAHFPGLVLDHVISIFTFMGDNTMRMDDNYSIQVVMESISTIIPVIQKKKDMVGIVRVFCDTLPHIPSHRADPIFSLLLETCGSRYLYHVVVFLLEQCSREREHASQFSYFIQTLTGHFGLADILTTAVGLIKTLAKLPDDLNKKTGKTHKVRLDTGVELSFSDAKHYNYFKLGVATQLYLVSTSKHFTGLLSDLEKEGSPVQEQRLSELIELALSIMIHYQVVKNDKFIDMLNKRLTGVVTKVTAGLPSARFISVVKALLRTDTPLLHTKSLNILLNKIKSDSTWSPDLTESTFSLVDILLELTDTQPLAWKILEDLAKRLGTQQPEQFLKVLSRATQQLNAATPHRDSGEDLRCCVTSCVEVLGVRCVTVLQELVEAATAHVAANVGILCVVLKTLPQFMSAYLGDVITVIAKDYSAAGMGKVSDELGERIKMRVLLPALVKSIDTVLSSDDHDLKAVTDTLSKCIRSNVTHDIKNHVTTITTIFVKLLSYRDTAAKYDESKEEDIISCFLDLVYKLTEKEFLPLLLQLMEWSEGTLERSTTFYNLSYRLSDKLQGLFLLFGGSIFLNLVEKLKQCKPLDAGDAFESKRQKKDSQVDLTKYSLRTLHNILRYDSSHSFITADRFDALLPVLLDLVPLPDIVELKPALAHLPIAANTERLWKQFNFQLLNLSKSHKPMVRAHVLDVYGEFIQKLGQDYSVLLPDTLPFLAELLEDSDKEVEDLAHEVVKKIEEVTGESMEQYL